MLNTFFLALGFLCACGGESSNPVEGPDEGSVLSSLATEPSSNDTVESSSSALIVEPPKMSSSSSLQSSSSSSLIDLEKIDLGECSSFDKNDSTTWHITVAKGLRFIIDNEGPYLEHCKEGKDRAGFVAAVLEGLMGASLEEIKADYLKTYTNYFKVKDGAHVQLDSAQTAWAIGIIVHNIQRFYVKAGVDSLSVVNARTGAEMSAITESYLQKLGLNNDEISKLKSRLAE